MEGQEKESKTNVPSGRTGKRTLIFSGEMSAEA